jgi:hypothetical protein
MCIHRSNPLRPPVRPKPTTVEPQNNWIIKGVPLTGPSGVRSSYNCLLYGAGRINRTMGRKETVRD